jgi:hypothetical protein
MKTRISAIILSLFLSQAALGQKLVPQGQNLPLPEDKKIAITADDLNGRYVVHGPLGVPLGEVITIVAEAVEHIGKGETEVLKVISVNGKALKGPVEMPYSIWPWAGFKKFENRKTYQLRVFQDGGFDGVPLQAMKETVSVQSHGYMFSTRLIVIRSLETAERVRPKQTR